ncbi:MAG TPA: zinc ribbon domain-containing protein [Pyrinomonadaceae bacterium]|nr:zinc ribbon domain-containing protein [Pyrinomonadaceae bacterium]
MYCPSCGNSVAEGLKYCNRCGASLGGDEGRPGLAGLTGPAWAISLAAALITLGGLAMLFVLGLTLINRGADLSPSGGIMMLAVLAVIALVDWMLIRQLARVIDAYRGAGVPPAPARRSDAARAPAELDERQPARLEAPREPFISVTEQTTRTLEQVPRERDTRPQPE